MKEKHFAWEGVSKLLLFFDFCFCSGVFKEVNQGPLCRDSGRTKSRHWEAARLRGEDPAETRVELPDCVVMGCWWSGEAVISLCCGRAGVNQTGRKHVDVKAQTFSFHTAFKFTFPVVWEYLCNLIWCEHSPHCEKKKRHNQRRRARGSHLFHSDSFHKMNTGGNRHFITAAVMAGNTFLYLK